MQEPAALAGFKTLGAPIRYDHTGKRLDGYLAEAFPFLSRNAWQKRIDDGEVLVNDKKVRASYKLRADDRVQMYHPESREPDVDTHIEVIYQEAGVLCAFKPAGLPMHEGGAFRRNTFARVLEHHVGPGWAAVHRLDKETSGLVLCGASEKIRRDLAEALGDGKIRKEYLAIVKGCADRAVWYVDAPIGNKVDSPIRIKNWVVPLGLPAMTEFMVEARGTQHTLLRAFPRTGRTNQIRIHAAYSGFPLVGDKLFHPDENVFLDYFENGMSAAIAEQTGHWRCCLHAHALSFTHPATGKDLRVQCDMPEDMQGLWENLALSTVAPEAGAAE